MLLEKLDLEADEVILKVVRKHWFVIVTQLIGAALFAILPVMFLTIILNLPNAFGLFQIHLDKYPSEIAFIISTWLLLTTLSGFVVWTKYYLGLWVITDRRIIVVNQISFFNRNVAIFRLERMQDIEFSVKGLIQTFFNFGTLKAQTASDEASEFQSSGMPNPDQLQATIQKAMDERIMKIEHVPGVL
jgi:Bacterial PH domain